MKKAVSENICRIALFMMWLIVMTPFDTVSALTVTYSSSDVSVSDTYAIINWTTDEASTGRVYFGTPGNVANTKDSSGTKKAHSVTITGIASETLFSFYIEAKNSTHTVREPSDTGDYYSFTTLAPIDRTAPGPVTGLSAPTITDTAITLSWTAPSATDIEKYYIFRNSSYLMDSSSTSYTDSGLNASTAYQYKVAAVDNSSNVGANTSVTATTRSEGYQALAISNFKAETIGTSIYATWITNIGSHTRLKYGRNAALLDEKKEVAENVTSHNITLTGLVEDANYTVMAESCDTLGNCGNSTNTTVQTSKKVALSLKIDGMDCDSSTKTYADSGTIDLKGTASAGSDVNVYVNGKRDRFKRVTSTGRFEFNGVGLDSSKSENIIKVTASDKVSTDITCEEYVLLDAMAPEVNFDNATLNMTYATQSSIYLKGNLTDDTKVTVYIYLQSVDDTAGPPAPQNVTNTSLSDRSIKISWNTYTSNDTNASDLYKYYIYRSDVATGPIAAVESTVTYYEDNNVSSGTTYTYQVSGMDKAGNEGDKSSAFSVTTDSGNTTASAVSSITPPTPGLQATKTYDPKNATIAFTETVSNLFDGTNKVTMKVVDEAGNEFTRTFSVQYSSEQPKIISPTAADLSSYYSPSYTSEVAINGQTNLKSGEVWVWVDKSSASITTSSMGSASTVASGEPTYKVSIGENGTFEVDVELTATLAGVISSSLTSTAGTTAANTAAQAGGISTTSSTGTPTRITMVAVNGYGQKSAEVSGSITYSPCGDKYYWKVNLKHGGNVMNSRELLEGVAAYGFGFELEWMGGGDATKAKAQNVVVRKATVGTKQASDYDFDWLSGEPRVLCQKGNCTKGFVTISFLPRKQTGNLTYLQMEQNISAHRKGECYPLVGCIHLLLEMQITSDPGPYTAQYSASGGPPVGTQQIGTQVQCMDIKIMLDERADFASSEFVRNLLNASLQAINATINFLDIIEKPVVYAAQITLGLCLLTYVSKFLVDAYTSYTCKWNSAITALTKGGAVDLIREIKDGAIDKVASMDDGSGNGACKIEFDKDDQATKAARDACTQCAQMKEKSRWITDKWHLFCDRVMCPSVPSLQYYISSKYANGKKSLWTPGAAEIGAAASAASSGGATNKCDNFNPDASGGGGKALTASCDCGGKTCAAGFLCLDGNCYTIARKQCTPNAQADDYCDCTGVVCAPGQTCDAGGTCKGRVASGSTMVFEPTIVQRTCPSGSPSTYDKCDCADSSGKTVTCTKGQTCKSGKCEGTSTAIVSNAVTDVNSESAYLPAVSEQQSSLSLITGYAAASTSLPSASANPVYNKVLPYVKGDWNTPYIKTAKSDCSFVDLGRGPIKSMYDFYNGKNGVGSAQDRAACEKAHKPQPACCPFEYMSEWGWGMMFSNEVTNSYCLALPESEECGTGTKLVNGVTGICQPTSTTPQARLVVLDGLKWNNVAMKYPKPSGEMIGDSVVYMVNLDEKGNPKSVKRGYYSKTEVESVSGNANALGRVKVGTGSYFVPEDDKELSNFFPNMDNTDIRNEKEVANGVTQFRADLEPLITSKKIMPKASSDRFDKTTYDNWYRQIAGLIGQPGRQYLAQPEGSFVQSLITLCLSGIATWIVMLKNMLTQLAICFQTILVTGDGSSGQCQQLISQYVCDLIKEAISCLVQRFGGGASARVGIGGIGGFFSSVADASKSITQEAQSRYGDKNMFSTTFAAENLMHDACIFMFTGEWPTDWGKLFETAAYLPVNSSALILRPTRRYQVYDPQTGFARYVYRIGYSVFAGADINFRLELVCSNGACTDGKDGKCDCGQTDAAAYTAKGRQTVMPITLHGTGNCPSNGNLGKLQSCTDEILFVGTGYYPLRYDSVRISYTPTQVTGTGKYGGSSASTGLTSGSGLGGIVSRAEAVSGSYESKITEIGGAPEGLCDFDIIQLAFRCGISVSATGSATFLSAELIKQSNQYYGIGDSDIARVKIAQKMPANAASCTSDCEFTKYLVIKEIKNQAGAIIYPKSGSKVVGERLNQEKIWDMNVYSDTYFPSHLKENKASFQISASDFGKQAPGACTRDSSLEGGANNVIPIVYNPGCSNVQSTTEYGLKVFYDGSAQKFTYYTASKNNLNAWTVATTPSDCTAITVNTATDKGDYSIICGGVNLTVLGDYVRSKGNVVSRGSAPTSSEAKKGSYGLKYTPPSSASSAVATCATQPEKWTMTLEIRDAVSTAGSYSMADTPSVDPDTNTKQTRPLTFNVLCKQSSTTTVTSGSIKDITSRTVSVTSDNNVYNKTYGMWVPDNYLGPTEDIKVSDFSWIDSTPANGFKINIDSTAANGVLNIDLTSLNVIPGSAFQVEKISTGATSGKVLEMCGTPPCVQSKGDVNTRVMTLRVSKGDPTFKFTGFDGATGAASVTGSTEIVLNNKNKYYPSESNYFLYLDETYYKVPANVNVTFKNYLEGSDNSSFYYSTSPPSNLDAVALGLCLKTRGFDMSNVKVKVDGSDVNELNVGQDKQKGYYKAESKDCAFIQTLGSSGESVEFYNLQKISTSTTSSLKDFTGQSLALTSSSTSQYGVTAAGLDSGAKVTMSSISTDATKGTVEFSVVTSGQTKSPVKLTVEVLPLGLNGNSDTKVEISGQVAALEDCSSSYSKPCVATRTGDRIILNIDASTNAKFRISGLKAPGAAAKECADKAAGASCTISGTKITGTCWEPSMTGATMQCFTDCRKSYVNTNSGKLEFSKMESDETKFCISSSSKCAGSATATTGLCGDSSLVCCNDGQGAKAVSTGGGGSGSAAAKPKACAGSKDGESYLGYCLSKCETGAVEVTDTKACTSSQKCCACPAMKAGTMSAGDTCPSGCDADCEVACSKLTPPLAYDKSTRKCSISECMTGTHLTSGERSNDLPLLPCMCGNTKLTTSGSSCCVLDGKKVAIKYSGGYSNTCAACSKITNCRGYYTEVPGTNADYWQKENCNDDLCQLPNYDCYWTSGKLCEIKGY